MYDEYFEIDSNTGRVRQVKALDRKLAKGLEIIVKVWYIFNLSHILIKTKTYCNKLVFFFTFKTVLLH